MHKCYNCIPVVAIFTHAHICTHSFSVAPMCMCLGWRLGTGSAVGAHRWIKPTPFSWRPPPTALYLGMIPPSGLVCRLQRLTTTQNTESTWLWGAQHGTVQLQHNPTPEIRARYEQPAERLKDAAEQDVRDGVSELRLPELHCPLPNWTRRQSSRSRDTGTRFLPFTAESWSTHEN